MSYRLRDLQLFRRQAFFLGVLVLLGFFELMGLDDVFRGRGEQLLRPLQTFATTMVNSFTLPIRSIVQQMGRYEHVQDLELRYAESLALLSEQENLRQENQELRSLLEGTQSAVPKRSLIAPVISYSQPVIAIGSIDGIQEGAVVLVAQTVVGRVSKVSAYQAKIDLLSTSESPFILAKTESGATGLVTGDGKKVLLTELPVEVEVKTGERVVTVGQPGVEPGLFIGKVESIRKDDSAPTQVATVDQIVSFFQVHVVEIRKQ